jgi:hypothetical protein|tara:strand:+ start:1156 stop:1509 length:354 start_codon:yes stop_codon:yes gene_type:complete
MTPFSTKAFRRKTPPSKEEIQEILFNDLMEQIEPELTSANREQTVEMFQELSDEELKERFERYKKAFETFVERWPAYIKEQIVLMNTAVKDFQSIAKNYDLEDLEKMEKQFESFDDA